VMIREPFPAELGHERSNRRQAVGTKQGKVTPEERSRRNSHLPAVFSISGEREMAEQLERELLDRGFQAALIHNHEVTAPAKRALYGTLWKLGVVVVSWQETPIGARERNVLNQIAGKHHFELARVEPVDASENDVSRGLRIAEGLRLESGHGKNEENGNAANS
jgi:hypothetical protein